MGGRNIDFICDRKLRLMTLKRRKMGLIKKAKELSTLCGVDLVLLLLDSSSSSSSSSSPSSSIDYAFPQDPLQARAIVDRYRSEFKKPKQNHRPRLRVLDRIPSKKKKPSPSQPCSSSLQMKLKAKIVAVRERIKFLKNTPSPPPLTEFEPVEEEPEHDDAGYHHHHQMEMLMQDNDGDDDDSSEMISDLLSMLEDVKESRRCFSQCPPRLLPHVSQLQLPHLLPLCSCVPKMNLDYPDDYCDCCCYMPLSPTTSSYQYPYQPMQQQQQQLPVNSPSVYFERDNSLTNLRPPRVHDSCDDDLMMMGMQREGSFMTATMMMTDEESQLQSQLPPQLLPLCHQYPPCPIREEYCSASPFDGLGLDYCFGV